MWLPLFSYHTDINITLASVSVSKLVVLSVPKDQVGRDWSHANKLRDLAEAAGIEVKGNPVAGDVLLQHTFPNGDAISVSCLLPTKDLQAQGQGELKGSRLSLINRVSVVMIVTFSRPGKQDLRALFTADADGKKIVSELHSQGKSATFDYVDMPHHGSGENHPKEFLCGFSAGKERECAWCEYSYHCDKHEWVETRTSR